MTEPGKLPPEWAAKVDEAIARMEADQKAARRIWQPIVDAATADIARALDESQEMCRGQIERAEAAEAQVRALQDRIARAADVVREVQGNAEVVVAALAAEQALVAELREQVRVLESGGVA